MFLHDTDQVIAYNERLIIKYVSIKFFKMQVSQQQIYAKFDRRTHVKVIFINSWTCFQLYQIPETRCH